MMPTTPEELFALPLFDRARDKRRFPAVPQSDTDRTAARDSNGQRWVVVNTPNGLRRDWA